ncbi:MAG: hypothetical protein R3F61_23640 [Myxococcota bacterium]
MREALEQWDGTRESAEDLRARFRRSPVAQGRVEAGGRGLAKIRRAYDSEDDDAAALVRWLAKNPDELAPLAPLLGDPALGRWPWSEATTIDDGLAEATLSVLGRVPVVVGSELRAFLRVLLRVRPRPMWTAAARAMARQARHDRKLADTIADLWAQAFPDRIELGGPATRLRRHALYLGACHVGLGGSVPGPQPQSLAEQPLPKDDADRSVALQALFELPAVQGSLRGLLVDRNHGPLAERVIVAALPELDEETIQAVTAVLAKPRWRDADGLLAWMDTVTALDLGIEDGGAASRALELAKRPVGTARDLVALLQEALTPGDSALVPPRRRACALAEAVALLDAPDVRAVPWSTVARLAAVAAHPELGPSPIVALPGTCGEVGRAAIGVSSALAGCTVSHLLRGTGSGEGVFAISGLQNPFVATQVAVQLEQTLRTLPGDSERLRVLWRLLQTDPPERTFHELQDMIRADAPPGAPATGPLVDVVTAVAELYAHREPRDDGQALAHAMRALADRLDALEVPRAPPLRELAALVEAPAPRAIELLPGVLAGVLAWTAWVDGTDLPASEASTDLDDLGAAWVDLEAASPLVRPAHAAGIASATERIARRVGGCGWPERHAVAFVLSRIRAASEAAVRTGHRARHAAREIDDALRVGDEDTLRNRMTQPEFLALLTPAQLEQVHEFLLAQLAWWTAHRFRSTVRDRVALPSLFGHFLPMVAAISGGALLVQDFGTEWVDAARTQHAITERHVWTVAIALVMAFATLTGTLARRYHSPDSAPVRMARVLGRALPIFAMASVVAFTANAVALFTLNQLEVSTGVVGGSLALFLGVFVGLVLQSQPAPRD